MKYFIGLGNPEEEYTMTKHNIGFQVLDKYIQKHQLQPVWFEEHHALTAQLDINQSPVLFIKPQTGMNNVGQVLSSLLQMYPLIDIQNDIIVIYDNMDLTAGRIKLKRKGSSHGHRGLESVINALHTDKFIHFSIGIDRPKDASQVLNYVLSPFDNDINDTLLYACAIINNLVDNIDDTIKVVNSYFKEWF